MTIQLTDQELAQVRSKRKADGKKPEYYNSSVDQTDIISDDFEAYLILQTSAQKQQVLQRLRQNIKVNNDTADRDAILKEFIKQSSEDLTNRLNEVDTVTNNFEDFRSTLLTGDERFHSVNEVNRLLYVLQEPIEEVMFIREQIFQEGNINILIGDEAESTQKDDKTKKELETWQKVISAYEGQ